MCIQKNKKPVLFIFAEVFYFLKHEMGENGLRVTENYGDRIIYRYLQTWCVI